VAKVGRFYHTMIIDLATVRAAHIVLASGSPRRTDILNNVLKLEARVVPSTFEEDLDKSRFTPSEYVAETALQKALDVYRKLSADGSPPSLVVGADTIVVRDATILEKPKSPDGARAMLCSLSGRQHVVSTAIALVYAATEADGDPVVRTFVESTKVNFAMLPPAVIDAYIESGEPFDKAGGYGIQGLGGSFVCGIEGCYWNVVGFPMHRFCVELDCERLREWVAESAAALATSGLTSGKRPRESQS